MLSVSATNCAQSFANMFELVLETARNFSFVAASKKLQASCLKFDETIRDVIVFFVFKHDYALYC